MMKFPTLAVLAVLLLAGCGYNLGEIRPTPMRSVQTLAVPMFKNQTYKPRVESLFADSLVKCLQQDGTYRIVNTNEADAILYCTIEDIDRTSLRAVQNNVLATSEYGLVVKVRYEVVSQRSGAVLMSGLQYGRASFFSGNDLVTIERQALSDAAADLSKNMMFQICEGW